MISKSRLASLLGGSFEAKNANVRTVLVARAGHASSLYCWAEVDNGQGIVALGADFGGAEIPETEALARGGPMELVSE